MEYRKFLQEYAAKNGFDYVPLIVDKAAYEQALGLPPGSLDNVAFVEALIQEKAARDTYIAQLFEYLDQCKMACEKFAAEGDIANLQAAEEEAAAAEAAIAEEAATQAAIENTLEDEAINALADIALQAGADASEFLNTLDAQFGPTVVQTVALYLTDLMGQIQTAAETEDVEAIDAITSGVLTAIASLTPEGAAIAEQIVEEDIAAAEQAAIAEQAAAMAAADMAPDVVTGTGYYG